METLFTVKGKPDIDFTGTEFLDEVQERCGQTLDEESKLRFITLILKHLTKNHNAKIIFKVEINFDKHEG